VDDQSPSEFSDAEITKILKEALKIKIEDKKKTPNRVVLKRALVSTISEFLGCFKLIGYDLDGNPINMTFYNSKLEKSALDNAFVEEIGIFMASRSDDE
jgi:hypothetical protein